MTAAPDQHPDDALLLAEAREWLDAAGDRWGLTRQMVERLVERAIRAEAKVQRLEPDARRWRYLRDDCTGDRLVLGRIAGTPPNEYIHEVYDYDATIDAALRPSSEEPR